MAFGDVCLNPYAVIHLRQLDRVVKSAFVHRDLFHLLANMTGVIQDGSYLESREGAATFLTRTAVLLALSQAGRGGGGLSQSTNTHPSTSSLHLKPSPSYI